ncbi:hypothetical protein Poli38472_003188 [Pythium oligandrum]|uniref:Jacalin-type lectin domain-containing protein n=1 Tax=Pythium oligandrum TaxID=41045 RepID=A0A8K1C6P0_PYTOL|nr:hypothetical protein Poli38472_003188 [Pythium oligandrum]|eukprot:TMW57263.1 hypothetical protein Poli38472_003188 [Pythium oligandrum]
MLDSQKRLVLHPTATQPDLRLYPYFSTLLGAGDGAEGANDWSSFGFDWQSTLWNIGAIHIVADTEYVRSLTQVASEYTEDSLMSEQFYVHSGQNIFQLVQDEKIMKVAVWFDDKGVRALQIHTNMRVSQPYGSVQGTHCVFEAKEGYHIHSLCGKHDEEHIRKVGVLFYPIRDDPPPTPRVSGQWMHTTAIAVGERPAIEKDMEEINRDVRALVLQCAFVVSYIWVISQQQYEDFIVLSDRITLSPDEQWVVLAEGEKITSVTTVPSAKRIESIRFTTTHRQTPWFGTYSMGTPITLATPDAYIYGFHGTYTDDPDAFTSLGVVTFQPEANDTDTRNTDASSTR